MCLSQLVSTQLCRLCVLSFSLASNVKRRLENSPKYSLARRARSSLASHGQARSETATPHTYFPSDKTFNFKAHVQLETTHHYLMPANLPDAKSLINVHMAQASTQGERRPVRA
jgi:hypothetical protein